ncbi:mannose-6-phosphate isomerase [Diorhabda carinulata]|uniref:mannose-6-phosphate isomerase n=1 Tax=Diorhabda carinulata TaxID=1163345 RepID=UPI0025A044E9|nr:mannose-6-phosphate isomerase [Diorhabda carinulata]
MELSCKVQEYDWGKRGSQSAVAQLLKKRNLDVKIDECKPYAELWMGTHVNAPSIIKETGELLSDYIDKNPKVLGEKVAEIFNNQLPFLFKILSVNKALSIQAHPTKQHAIELNKKFPDIYKDPNHKPEMAIALTPFEAMCGFRNPREIREFITHLPELENITRSKDEVDDVKFLEKSFRAILTCEKDLVAKTIESLKTRFANLEKCERDKYLSSLLDKLNSQFPNDNGVLMVYFLNYIKLQPSEAIYLAANKPHAYIYGDCVEMMASSDNVVRAGLTPKLRDVQTLLTMLDYTEDLTQDSRFKPQVENEYTTLYKPPVQEFAVVRIKLPKSIRKYTIPKRDSASIIIVIDGTGKSVDKEVVPGLILFLAAQEVLEIIEVYSESILMYQGFTNVE